MFFYLLVSPTCFCFPHESCENPPVFISNFFLCCCGQWVSLQFLSDPGNNPQLFSPSEVGFFFSLKNPFLFLSQKCLMFLFHCSGLTQTLPFERWTFLHSNALLGISMKSFDKNKTPSKTLLFLFSRKCSLHYLNSRLPVFCHFDCSGTKDRHGAWLGRDLT